MQRQDRRDGDRQVRACREKIASSLSSTGTPAFFVHSAEAAHGDSGMIEKRDVVLLLSNSGETQEVLNMLAIVRSIGSQTIAVTSNGQSTLALHSGIALTYSYEKEADHLGLAPTTSAMIQLAIGDALAVTMSRLKAFNRDDFYLYHPGGSLGKQLQQERNVREGENMNIVVIGSFMMDLVVRAEQAPKAGETVMGHAFARFPGGKGANQAVAMAGMLGRDEFGREMLAVMQREGINTDHILFSESDPTGIGSIVLEPNGENRIVVVPGANLRYSGQELHGIEDLIRSASMLVMQLEMDPGMTEEAVALASRYRVPVLLNPAPARPLSGSLLRQVTYLTPNEAEAELLTGIPATSIDGAQAAGRALLHAGVRHVVITMADKGAVIVDDGGSA
ncbi:PfkB family carbohydrate kinase [Paenibacillus dendritiformis]|uniref:PfkB family carbohydrate kinase n=1 Tax=Paenibacillus dendritiformis TaxID=130049 RepID=UPI001F54E6A7|nr:PfkB family carbohydrate kinase [Paenibacillus dendritiformis]